MSDTITQTRLSLRLESYMSDFRHKNPGKDHFLRREWDAAWQTAEAARMKNALTPELDDDVRIVVKKL
jgi:hypothetical protein